MEHLGILLDVGCIACVIICTIFGRLRGMVKMLRTVILPILAVALAILANPTVAPMVEEQPFFSKVETKVSSAVVDRFPDFPAPNVTLSEQQQAQIKPILSSFGIEWELAEEAILEGQQNKSGWEPLFDLIGTAVAKAIAYVGVFLLSVIVLRILFYFLGLVFAFPGLKGFNRTAGTVLGAVRGLITVMFVAFFLHKIATALYTVFPSFCEGVNDSYIISALGTWLSAVL